MTPTLSSVRRLRHLSDQVFQVLMEHISAKRFPPGGQLPTEQQLAVSFDVSRAVVREALACLKADGFVETRQGSGAFVTQKPGGKSFKLIEGGSAPALDRQHIFELRAAVEVEAAGFAALRRTEADLAAIRAGLTAMTDALRAGADGSEADDRFHQAIAAATHNPHIRRLLEFLNRQFSDTRRLSWMEIETAGEPAAAKRRNAQREHERMFAAIVAGDKRAARREARQHLVRAMRRLGIGVDR
ncbi:MAG: FadR family transcriptional regulator [Rhodospirillales bacterium]|nr:FadR family transcriptional regulator [Rhodospirillales bacterium]